MDASPRLASMKKCDCDQVCPVLLSLARSQSAAKTRGQDALNQGLTQPKISRRKDSPPSNGDPLPRRTIPKYFAAYFVHPQVLDRVRSEISE